MTDVDEDSPADEPYQREVLAEHLPTGYGTAIDTGGATTIASGSEAGSDTGRQTLANPTPDTAATPEAATEQSSLLLHGGDIHRDLYKLGHPPPYLSQRSNTFSHPDSGRDSPVDFTTASDLLVPQGFRRQFLARRLGDRADDSLPFTRNFVDFLALYGSFAGEDLEDSEDGAIEDESVDENGYADLERRPLLRRETPRAVKRADASTIRTFFTTLKAFIGTGIMFLPKAFNNGGILFSSITLVFVATISMWAFHLLLQCRTHHAGGYGEIGAQIGGRWLGRLILTSITISQLGFVCTGLVFVADNWESVLLAISPAEAFPEWAGMALLAAQALILIPMSFIRDIGRLGPAALVADLFILVGIVYIWSYDITTIAERGIHPSVVLFNPSAYTLTIGSAIFTFEGIGLVLPIQASMAQPDKFQPLLAVVMGIITVIFTSIGALSYATFGKDTKIEVIDNFPQGSRLVNTVQFLYGFAILVGNPVQLFPAMRIIEGMIFGRRSGRRNVVTKWEKNAFRAGLVVFCIAVAIGGSANLDRFVALIGSVACVPLVYIYPPYLHLKAVAQSRREKVLDVAFMALGAVGMVYTTSITIATSFM